MTTETAPQPNLTAEDMLLTLDATSKLPRMAVEAAIAEERQRILDALQKTYLSHNMKVVRNVVRGRSPYAGL